MPIAKLEDISIYYEIHGQGYPLVLIAGLGCDTASWAGVIEPLSRRYQVVVFDNRHSGRTTSSGEACTIPQMAEDAARLLEKLGITRAHILGHSMGGYIAQELAIRFPQLVDKLILESTGPTSSSRNNELFALFHKWLAEGMSLSLWFRSWAFWLFTPAAFTQDGFIDRYVQQAATYPHLQTAQQFGWQADAMTTFDSREHLVSIQAPTLILTGSEDVLIVPRESDPLEEGIAGSSLKTIEHAAHALHGECPDAFMEALLPFLG